MTATEVGEENDGMMKTTIFPAIGTMGREVKGVIARPGLKVLQDGRTVVKDSKMNNTIADKTVADCIRAQAGNVQIADQGPGVEKESVTQDQKSTITIVADIATSRHPRLLSLTPIPKNNTTTAIILLVTQGGRA